MTAKAFIIKLMYNSQMFEMTFQVCIMHQPSAGVSTTPTVIQSSKMLVLSPEDDLNDSRDSSGSQRPKYCKCFYS